MSDETFDADVPTVDIPSADVQFEDDNLTEAQFKELIEGRNLADGQYELVVKTVKRVAPVEGRYGGDTVSFTVVNALSGQQAPADGWPPISRTFKQYVNPTDGQKVSIRMDRELKASLLKACGIEETGGVNVWQALQSIVGTHVLGTVTSRKSNTGRMMKDVGDFKPVS